MIVFTLLGLLAAVALVFCIGMALGVALPNRSLSPGRIDKVLLVSTLLMAVATMVGIYTLPAPQYFTVIAALAAVDCLLCGMLVGREGNRSRNGSLNFFG